MASQCTNGTNKDEITRDVYEAQRIIPVDILKTIYRKTKPLNRNDIEENGQVHVDNVCTDIKFKSGPDLKLIEQMLNMVKQLNTSPDTVSVGAESIIEIRKVNAEHKANHANSINMHDKFKMPKEKRQRNVALASILEAIEVKKTLDNKFEKGVTIKSVIPRTEPHTNLLKPFETVKEINCIVNTRNVNITSVIFKKNVDETLKTEFKRLDNYKPSVMANLYYKKYLERSKLKELMHHIFKLEAEKLIKLKNIKDMEIICLPQHRHLLTEDCIVCQVFCKKKFFKSPKKISQFLPSVIQVAGIYTLACEYGLSYVRETNQTPPDEEVSSLWSYFEN